MKIGIVVAEFYEDLTDEMVEKAEKKAEEKGFEVEKVKVAGAYDTPLAADRMARKDDVDAVAVLGAIVSGDTDHDQVIGHSVAEKLSQISLDRDKPVTLGVTGPGMSADEAYARKDYGAEAVEAASRLLENLGDLS
jgi:6,7-dimethyl-8-ribityllumazine synthase